MPQSSIIIPVYNQWQLTSACLQSLAATVGNQDIEIIVVDNASNDETPLACPAYGKQLFGSAFHYERCEKNINFGPASNLGARMAKGDYLIFLNNDTEALPDWYQPLLADFRRFPRLGVTGPLLLYPKRGMVGYTVQHLGVCISHLKNVTHLYEGIPADAELAKKRRFFQIITAACMMVPRQLFFDIGQFDEQFVNGFEDVEFCARLTLAGYQLTVHPDARIIHYQGQSAGRNAAKDRNGCYLAQTEFMELAPDWHTYVKADAMLPSVNEWAMIVPALPPRLEFQLNQRLPDLQPEALEKLLLEHPYWRKGWEVFKASISDPEDQNALAVMLGRLFLTPDFALERLEADLAAGVTKNIPLWDSTISGYNLPYEKYWQRCRNNKIKAARNGIPEMAICYEKWLANREIWLNQVYNPMQGKLATLIPQIRKLISMKQLQNKN